LFERETVHTDFTEATEGNQTNRGADGIGHEERTLPPQRGC
jgi:hypothetical protein